MKRMTVNEIKKELEGAKGERLQKLLSLYRQDPRSSVAALVKKQERKLEKLKQEYRRLEEMTEYERRYEQMDLICGIDEAGRGPLAGPVVAAAVILPKDCRILYLNDSKKLSAAKREELYDVIMAQAKAVGIGYASPARIDEINILQATYEAMRAALDQLSVKPQILLNDAVRIPKVDIPQVPIVKGDAKSISIAAASIIAKVTRDRLMIGIRPDHAAVWICQS